MRTSLIVLCMLVTFATACSKKSSVEGVVLDSSGRALSELPIVAIQLQPIKGYERLQGVSRSDGKFTLTGVYPGAEYALRPESPKWETDAHIDFQAAPQGETAVLQPLKIQRAFTRTKPWLLADLATGQPAQAMVQGVLVDWASRPVSGVKIRAVQVEPVAGYSIFEASTERDGAFRFSGLLAMSQYTIEPFSNKWTTTLSVTIKTPSNHGELLMIDPLKIQFAGAPNGRQTGDLITGSLRFTKTSDGVIKDAITGLEWLVGRDEDTSYAEAENWIKSIRIPGREWRMPTQEDMARLRRPYGQPPYLDAEFATEGWQVWLYPPGSGQPRQVGSYHLTNWGPYGGLETYSFKGHRVFAVR
jgi:hypothetical protein